MTHEPLKPHLFKTRVPRHYLRPSISHRRQGFFPRAWLGARVGGGWGHLDGNHLVKGGGGEFVLQLLQQTGKQAGLPATPPEQRQAVMWPQRPWWELCPPAPRQSTTQLGSVSEPHSAFRRYLSCGCLLVIQDAGSPSVRSEARMDELKHQHLPVPVLYLLGSGRD